MTKLNLFMRAVIQYGTLKKQINRDSDQDFWLVCFTLIDYR